MHFQRKVERSLNNKTLLQRECPEFQTNELRNVERNETADFVVILHIRKRKSPYGNITLMPFIYL